MENQLRNILSVLPENNYLTYSVAVVVLLGIMLWSTHTKLPNLPVVGNPDEADLRSAMEEGTKKYPDTPFILPLADPTVILPLCELDRVKSLPDTEVSLNRNNYRRFFGQYTMMGAPAHEFIGAIKEDLTQSLNVLLPEMVEETAYAMQQATKEGAEKESIQVPAYPSLLQVITLVSGRVMVGLPLSRDPKWLHSSIHYAIDSVMASDMLRGYPKWMQPLVGFYSKQIAAVRDHQMQVRDMLKPILERQEVKKTARSLRNSTSENKEGRLVAWLADHYAKNNKLDVDVGTLGKDHLLALFAAIHIATNALTQSVLDLAARSEYVEPLRKELEEVGVHVDQPGSWTTAALAKLEKMDSFIQESLHWSPPGGVVAILRETQVPLRLTCGVTVPAGQLIAFPNTRFNKSQDESQDFDGFRYFKMREKPGQKSKYQLTTPRRDLLTYGYGTHSCPGRAFATAQIKLALAYLLQKYENVSLPEGMGRPPNSSRDWQIMPSPDAAICLKQM